MPKINVERKLRAGLGDPATCCPVRPDLEEFRRLVALLDPERTASGEPAADRRREEIGRHARDCDEALPLHLVEAGRGVQERPGVGMLGLLQDLGRRAFFDNLAAVHDDHTRAEVGNDSDVVADQDDRDADHR